MVTAQVEVPTLAGPSAALAPETELATAAARLLVLIGRRGVRPQRWGAPAFGREVELVRSHLRVLGTPISLAASFGREAFHVYGVDGDEALATNAVRVAYAIRWIELQDGVGQPGWRALIGGVEATSAG